MKYQFFTAHRITALMILVGLFCAGNVAATEPKDMIGAEIYTLTNLHPDDSNMRLYSTNYQQPGRIKVCSKVRIKKATKKKMVFQVVESSREYTYLFHRKSTPEGFTENINRYFGAECPSAEIATMSAVDQEGIEKTVALEGMTRRGVIIAMGYPPQHVTPDTNYDEWMYWTNKFARDAVVFGEDGKVSHIRK